MPNAPPPSSHNTHLTVDNNIRFRDTSQGRKPKIKSPRDLSTPVHTTNNKGSLTMSVNLKLLAQALDMAERLA
eukprot:scaffold192860_cov37-Tisochrysis_lutea.AAC.2